MIRRNDFIRAFSKRYGVPLKYAKMDVERFWELIAVLLYDEKEDIVINGVCSLKQVQTKERQVVHPTTGELVTAPSKRKIKFNMPDGIS